MGAFIILDSAMNDLIRPALYNAKHRIVPSLRNMSRSKKILEFVIKRINRSYSKISEFIYKIDELSLKKKKPINFKTINEIL